jgi:hypothetical protein
MHRVQVSTGIAGVFLSVKIQSRPLQRISSIVSSGIVLLVK